VLEEGLRGAGGYLTDAEGERFMSRYDPERMERSTRDLVSRAGYMEIQAGRGTPDGAVLLDVSHLGAEFVERTFPGMTDRCREVGFDLAREPVKVSPTAHFHMGGAQIDPSCRTNLEGLFVAGEDSGGAHGANRLGGNGVAESTVFGARAGRSMAEYVHTDSGRLVPRGQVETAIKELLVPMSKVGDEDIYAMRREIEDLMWEKVGLVRDGQGLEFALEALDGLSERLGNASVPAFREYNLAWQEWLNMRSMLTVARLTCLSAMARKESRGSHYRSDFPSRNDEEWLRNVFIQLGEDEKPRLWEDDVRFTRMRPDDVPTSQMG
jgi:succinate dehydrogenase / fumarate reductase flavoprotein subunit/fumarate reductase flavoprotein subunit